MKRPFFSPFMKEDKGGFSRYQGLETFLLQATLRRWSAARRHRRGKQGTTLSILIVTTALLLSTLAPLRAFGDENLEFRRARAAVSGGRLLEAQGMLEDFIERYPHGRNTARAKYLLGQVLYRRADFAGAARVFSETVEAHPDWDHADRAAYGKAMSQFAMLDYSGAAKTLDGLLKKYPESENVDDSLYWLGEALYRRADYSAALARFNQFLASYPGHAFREYAIDSVAWCLELLEKEGEAIKVRETFLRDFPKSSLKGPAELRLATDYLRTGDRQAAIKHNMLAESSDLPPPLRERAMLRAGLLLAETNQFQEAADVLEKLLATKPQADTAEPAMAALGNCHLKAANYEKAENVFKELVESGKDKEYRRSMAFQLALAQMARGKFAVAADQFSAVIDFAAHDSMETLSAVALAECFSRLDRPGAAAEKLRPLLDGRSPSDRRSDVTLALAGSLFRANRFDEAGRIYAELSADKEAVKKWPQIPYYEGLCHFHMARYGSASEKFAEFVRGGKPEALVPPAGFMKADSLLMARKLDEAKLAHKAFIEKWPENPLAIPALYQTGLAHMLTANYTEASSALAEVVRSYPSARTVAPARYFLGLSRMKAGDAAGALEIFRVLADNNMEFELADRAALAYGWLAFSGRDYETAVKVFTQIESKFPRTEFADFAWFFTGASHYRQRLPRTAGAHFQRLPKLFPKSRLNAEALIWAGLCEERLNNPANALRLYEQALQMSREPLVRAEALYSMGWAAMRLANSGASTAAFVKLTSEYPREPLAEHAYYWQGRLDFGNGRWDGARESLFKLSEIFPNSPLADASLFFAARAARKSSDYPKAVALFESLTSRYPRSLLLDQAEIEAAESTIEGGGAALAAQKLQSFIDKNVASPLRPLAVYDMGKALQRAGKFDEAIEQYRIAPRGESTEPAARSRFAIAECLAELDRTGEAVAELVAIARGGFPAGWPERAQLQAARLLERDGRPNEARQMYESVAETYGDDAAGMVALKAIRRMEKESENGRKGWRK
ncbi:tetratricopeptide repeat protein [Candidatus Poribacteria bacterium]|nr:tetratricopeptide repeat protein [Candidatus Poribacteria bacterium]